jgi:hypothetical protein
MLAEFGDQLIIVEHHSHDAFEIPWNELRIDLYSSALMPTVRIDGKYCHRGAESAAEAANNYRPLINQRLAETNYEAQVDLGGSYWIDGDFIYAAASFELVGPETPTNPRAYILLLVDGLVWNDVTYHDVTQGAYEEELDLVQIGDAVTINTSFEMDPEWTPEMVHCIAFEQDIFDSLQVRQAIRLPNNPFNGIDDPVAFAQPNVQACPNPWFPAAGAGNVRFMVRHDASATGSGEMSTLGLYDSSGRLIRTLSQPGQGGAEPALIWDGRNEAGGLVPTGTYWAKPVSGDHGASTRLVIIR